MTIPSVLKRQNNFVLPCSTCVLIAFVVMIIAEAAAATASCNASSWCFWLSLCVSISFNHQIDNIPIPIPSNAAAASNTVVAVFISRLPVHVFYHLYANYSTLSSSSSLLFVVFVYQYRLTCLSRFLFPSYLFVFLTKKRMQEHDVLQRRMPKEGLVSS